MLREQGEHALVNPATLPELDRELHLARQRRQKLRERRELVGSEVGPELDENRTELVFQLGSTIVEFPRDVRRVAESALVGDLLRHLEREGESRRRSIGPAAHGLARWDRVERGVDFDGVECTRVDRE